MIKNYKKIFDDNKRNYIKILTRKYNVLPNNAPVSYQELIYNILNINFNEDEILKQSVNLADYYNNADKVLYNLDKVYTNIYDKLSEYENRS